MKLPSKISNECLVIIPSYNEKKNLPQLLRKINQKKYFILIVDDCSTDWSHLLVEKLCNKIIRNKKNLGVDASINQGFKFAIKNNFKYIITLDADGQHKPEYLDKIFKYLKSYDLVVTQRDKFPRLSEKVFSIYSKFFFNIDDLLSGMKGYSKRLFNEYKCYDTINSIGSELAIYALKNNYKFKILSIKVNSRDGASKLGGILKGNFKIFRALIKVLYLFK
jgi:glycosyltransferase involved in cell wall biosynthesis